MRRREALRRLTRQRRPTVREADGDARLHVVSDWAYRYVDHAPGTWCRALDEAHARRQAEHDLSIVEIAHRSSPGDEWIVEEVR